MKDKCWILHPHLKPNKFKDARAHLSNEGEGHALAALKSTEDGMIRRLDLDALIKSLKENLANTFGKSCIASNISKSLIIDSGASHHMISNSKLINDIEPALGNVVIANGNCLRKCTQTFGFENVSKVHTSFKSVNNIFVLFIIILLQYAYYIYFN